MSFFHRDPTDSIEIHNHSRQIVRPTAAVPVPVTSGGGPWNLGIFFTIIAADDIDEPFDLHWAVISDVDANEDYELVFYYGATDIECARVPFTRSNNFVNSISVPLMTPLIPADSQVRCKLMDGAGGNAANVKVLLHEY